MATSNPETIELHERTVYDGRKPLTVIELHIDGCHRASVEQQRNGDLKFRFQPVGAFQWQEAQVWLQGLLELSMVANKLEANHGGKKEKRQKF